MSRSRVSQSSARGTKAHQALVQALHMAGRELSTATVMFHTALAEQVGLSSTEEKALDLLDREGPLTPGALAVRTGLAAPSITGLVNRLERKGFARRRTNPNDRRSFLVEARADRLSSIAPLFRSFTASLEALYAGYRKDQLETILQFLRESARIQSAATARLTAAKRRAGTN